MARRLVPLSRPVSDPCRPGRALRRCRRHHSFARPPRPGRRPQTATPTCQTGRQRPRRRCCFLAGPTLRRSTQTPGHGLLSCRHNCWGHPPRSGHRLPTTILRCRLCRQRPRRRCHFRAEPTPHRSTRTPAPCPGCCCFRRRPSRPDCRSPTARLRLQSQHCRWPPRLLCRLPTEPTPSQSLW